MPDYIYLLENRLSPDQRTALRLLREAAREAEMILFLTGDAVRDLTSGHAVHELEVAVHGNALKLKKIVERSGGKTWGEDAHSQSLYLCFPGTVRVDVISTHSVEYKKPGHPTYHFASIQEDLRRRDFTANAMAISLNEGSFGLLMDPLNGVADIEARILRLVSNYGFIEDPSLMIRATRLKTRLGWEMDPRTQTRYENAKAEDTIQYLSEEARRRELEQIGHEDDGLRVLQALEAEGWMKVLYPQWTSAKADEVRLKALHELVVELLMQGVHPDTSAAQMQLLTAKLAPKDLAGLKKEMLRSGFVEEWNGLDNLAAGFAKVLMSKENQTPSSSFKLFTSYDPEAVLWLGFTTRDVAVKDRYNSFLKVWPEMRSRIPYALMQEMRIRAELPNYGEIIHAIFLELIDGKLTTPEEMRAFLEPYSPPAPPPQITIKRSRGRRGAEPKARDFDEDEEAADGEEDLDDMGGGDEDDIGLGVPKIDIPLDVDEGADEEDEEGEGEEAEEEEEHEPVAVKRGKAGKAAKASPAPPDPAKVVKGEALKHPVPAVVADKHAASKVTHSTKPAPAIKPAPAPAKVAPAKPAPEKHAPVKAAPAKASKTAAVAKKPAPPAKPAVKKATLTPHAKPAHKSVPKAPVKKSVVAKVAPKAAAKPKPHKPAKPAPKKPAKTAKKH